MAMRLSTYAVAFFTAALTMYSGHAPVTSYKSGKERPSYVVENYDSSGGYSLSLNHPRDTRFSAAQKDPRGGKGGKQPNKKRKKEPHGKK